jgi:O-antigen/teichoic acid export membrane protein
MPNPRESGSGRRHGLISRGREMLLSDTARNSFIVACGQSGQALASLATMILLSRRLGPAGFGVFSIALGAATTAAPIMDFGLDASMVRQVARANAAGDIRGIARLVQAYAQIKTIFFILVGGAGAALSGWIARDLLRYPHADLLRCACVGALGLNLLTLGRGLLEARLRFRDVAVLTAGTSLLRLAFVGALLAAAAMTPGTALVVYLAAPALGLVYAAMRLRDVPFLRSTGADLIAERRELVAFGGWIGILMSLAALSGYLDMLLISRWCGATAAGYYSAAYKFAFVLVTASLPLSAVLRARASAFGSIGRIEEFLAKAKIVALLAVVAVAAVWVAAPLAVRLFLGPAYAPAAALLRILAIGTGFIFASVPYSMTFYALGRSKPLAVVGLSNAVFFLLALWMLIPRYGIMGAAYAFSLTHGFGLALMLVLVRTNMARGRAEEAAASLEAFE